MKGNVILSDKAKKVLNDPDLAISILSQYVKGYGITNHILRDDLLAKIAELEVQPVENYGLIPVEQIDDFTNWRHMNFYRANGGGWYSHLSIAKYDSINDAQPTYLGSDPKIYTDTETLIKYQESKKNGKIG